MSRQGVLASAQRTAAAPTSEGPTRVDTSSGDQRLADRVSRAGVLRNAVLRVASALAAVGLFTVSWDRLLNVQVAAYNVKIPSLVFTLAFFLAVVSARGRVRSLVGTGHRRVIAVLVALIVGYGVVRGIFTPAPSAAAAQLVALLTGAIMPAGTLLLLVRDDLMLRRALRWLLRGAALAAAFGLYQLAAFYLGWPQGVSYTGVGIGTGLGRISAFNYEPAYFAYYLLLALGACVALRRLEGRDIGWWQLAGFAAMLYLANVRAVPLVVLAFAVLLLFALRTNRALLLRGAVVGAVTVAIAVMVPIAVTAVVQAQQQSVEAHDGTTRSSADGVDAPAQDSAAGRALESGLQGVNPDEPSSNGPRLDLYRAVLAQVAKSPVVGLGPGQLAASLRSDAPQTVTDQGGGQVVANNIWLQALADGGVPLLLLELALVAVVVSAAIRRRTAAVFPLAASWLAVIGVGGILTSYLFDIKIFVVLALMMIGLAASDRDDATRLSKDLA